MKKKILIAGVLIIALFILFSGKDNKQAVVVNTDPEAISAASGSTTTIVQKGNRSLGIDITTDTTGDYTKSFNEAKTLGMQFVQLSLAWDDIEKTPGVIQNDFLGIANSYYPPQNTKVALNLSPIDTNANRMPTDLKTKSFDDPEVVSRFEKVIDYAFAQTPNVQFISISIGNEIDIYLNAHPEQWASYTEFYRQISSYVKSVKPGVPVGSKMTFGGFLSATQSIKNHTALTDAILLTYYPVDSSYKVKDVTVITTDFSKMAAATTKPIYILEAGYPSGSANGSTETKQVNFVKKMFAEWDKYPTRIKAINFVWLHDLSNEAVAGYKAYYGANSTAFGSYLQTMGLRRYDDSAKPSFAALDKEAQTRGW